MVSFAIAMATVLAATPTQAEGSGPSGATPQPWRGLVVVLAAETEDLVVRNARARIAGELAAAPFRVIERPLGTETDLITQVETGGEAFSASATFAITLERPAERMTDGYPDPAPPTVAVWVSNRLTNRTTIQRLQIEEGDVDRAARLLAIEAVETIRASLGELWPRSPRRREPEPECLATPASAPRAHFDLSLALGVLADGGRSPALWAPAVAVGYGRGALELRLRAMGSSLAASVEGPDGVGAALRRGLLSLALVHVFRADRRLRPLLLIEAGAQVLTTEPLGVPPERTERHTAWSVLSAAGGGLRIMLGPGLALDAEAQLGMLWPPTVVRAATNDLARFDRPALLARAGLLASF